MTAAKVTAVFARLPECAGAADAVSVYAQVKWRTHQGGWRFQSQNVQKVQGTSRATRWILTSQHHIFTTYLCDVLNVNGRRTRVLLNSWEKSSNHEFFCHSNWNITRTWETSRKNLRVVPRHGGTCSKVFRDIVKWQLKRRSNCTIFQVLAWMIATSRSWKQSENCPMYVFEPSWMHVFGSNWWLDILWSVNKFTRAITKMDKSLWRRWAPFDFLFSSSNDIRQHSHVGNTAKHCRLDMFWNSDFLG